jgi:hypothetical protein
MIGFISTLYTPLGTTRNYSTTADLHTLQFTAANTNVLSLLFTSRFLTTNLTHWRFFSIRGHAVGRWLTLHTWTHSAIFSASPCRAQLSTNCSLGTPELDSILILAAWDPRYISSWRTQRKPRCLYCCVLIHCCRDMFSAQLRSNEWVTDPQRTPLGTLLQLRDVTAYVTRSSAAMAVSLPPQFLLWANSTQYRASNGRMS